MATRYWVGGTGTWDSTSTANWSTTTGGASGASAPTSADTVVFDTSSGTGTCTTDATAAASIINYSSATVTLLLGANFTMSGTFTHTQGALNLGNNTLTCLIFVSNTTNVRSIAFGTGNITLTGNGAIIWNTYNATSLTLTGTPVINATYSGGTGTRTLYNGITANTNVRTLSLNVTNGTDTVDLQNFGVANNVNFTGFGGTLTNNTYTIYGNLTISSGMTLTAGTAVTTFGATSGTQQITTAGKTLDFPITQNGAGGIVQLQDNLTMGSTRNFNLTSGTLDLNNKVLSVGNFSSSNSNTRSIAFGTGNITLTGNATTIWSMTTGTGFTYTGTPTVNCTYSGATGTRTISSSPPSNATAPNFNVTAGTDTVTFTNGGGYYANNINLTGFAGTFTQLPRNIFGSLTIPVGVTTTITASLTTFTATSAKTIDINGATLATSINFDGVGGSWQLLSAMKVGSPGTLTLTNGSIDLNNNTLSANIFSSSNANTRSILFGASGQLNITGNATTVFQMSNTTGFTYTGTSYVNLSYAGGTGTRTLGFTTAASESNALNLKVTAGSDTVSLSGSAYRNLDFTGFSGTLPNSVLTLYGSLTYSSSMTLSAGSNTTTFASTAAGNMITSAGKTMDFPITFNGVGGVWTCQDALTLGSTRALTLTNGTLNLKSGATSTVGSFVTTGTNQKYLGSSTPGTQATISDASGVNSVSFLTIQDSVATGGADWEAYASNGNIDAGNNLNWDFGATPILGTEYEYKLRSFTQPRRF